MLLKRPFVPKSDAKQWFTTTCLLAANGSAILAYGKRTIPLWIGSQRYEWQFIIANVAHPLLGADFLCENSVLVD